MASKVIVIESGRDMFVSEPWIKLTAPAIKMYMIFLTKRKIVYSNGRKHREKQISNNGKIEFTYTEAMNKLKISRPTVTNSIDQLVKYGFIDISQQGGYFEGNKTLYAISNRWIDYGTDSYKKEKRKKDNRQNGFKLYPENINKKQKKVKQTLPVNCASG